MHVEIHLAGSRADVEAASALFVEYWEWLKFDRCFQGFEEELASLPGRYGPPDGCLLLARKHGAIVGCVALRKIGRGTCEMKRLYVRPSARGHGVGLALAQRVIDEARKKGYQRMRLDTLPTMKSAITLYESLGFRDIPPYSDDPTPGARFMELAL